MKWTDVEITDEGDKVHSGSDALRFVETKCKPIAINTNWDGLIQVNTNSPSASTEDKEVRSFLFSKLKGKAKSLRFTKGKKFQRETLPLARAVPNVVIVNPARLKIQFIYKQDPRSNSKIYLKDPVVSVTVDFAGNKQSPAATTQKNAIEGVVDLGAIPVGKYMLTPDYSNLEECKFDFEVKPQDIYLNPGDNKTVTFEVEPLYQKVQLIAHCLLAIPDRIFVPSEKDKNKLNITGSKGKVPFKTRSVQVGLFTKSDLKPALLYPQGEFKTDNKGIGTLTFKKKRSPEVGFWTLDNLDKNTLNPEMIEIGKKLKSDPDVYEVKFMPRFSDEPYTIDDLEGTWKGKYHGLLRDRDDMTARVNLTKATLEYAHTKAKDDPTILKVFMLPECFFQGRYGAYQVEDADHLLTQLLDMVGDVKWRDWVFVFGTVNLTFGKDIREMMNYSPVIRGGLGPADKASGSGGQNDTHLRLIQKLTNSAELLDAIELIHNEDEKRQPSVNDDVQFQATQNEEKVGEILRKLLDKDVNFKDQNPPKNLKDRDFGERKGLTPEQWTEVKAELVKSVSKLGLTRVVRSIRVCKIVDAPNLLSGWGNFSGYENKTEAQREPVSWIKATSEGLILGFIKDGWKRYRDRNAGSPAFTVELWQEDTVPGAERRNEILTDIQNHLNELVQPFEIVLPYQKNILRNKIQELLEDDPKAVLFGASKAAAIPENFGASIYPIWKKILELYCIENALDKELLIPDPDKMDYHDYCFASRRKAGPWLPLEKVESLPQCKKLLFGLEICADHGSGNRIKRALALQEIPSTADQSTRESIEKSNASKAKVKLDIQLVPSAGFYPTELSIVARRGGYCFNCDGWNKGGASGVNLITAWFDGPEDPTVNPVTPHTAIAKGGDGVSRDMATFKPEPIKLSDVIDPELGNGILNRAGLGELHIYKELDLPEN